METKQQPETTSETPEVSAPPASEKMGLLAFIQYLAVWFYNESRPLLRLIIARAKNFEAVSLGLVADHLTAGQVDDAIWRLKMLLLIKPKCEQAWLTLADIYTDVNMHAEAQNTLQKALRKLPSSAALAEKQRSLALAQRAA